MSGRSHFAAPLLLAIIVALILYVSLYPFRFGADGPAVTEVLRQLSWARASRGDMLNNVLLYVPLGFCIALAVEPRFGRSAGIWTGLLGGALLSLTMELMQGSIATRVPSLTDLSLNAAGALAGAIGGSAWHALGARMTPQANPAGRSGAVALVVLVLWLIARLWPFVPDASLRQLKRAVRPLFSPELGWTDLAAFFVGWLVVAQAVFHLARRQRSVDVFLIVIAAVLVGRTFTAGNTLEFAELAAIALLLPVLVLISRVEDRGRSALLAAALGTWLASIALLAGNGRRAWSHRRGTGTRRIPEPQCTAARRARRQCVQLRRTHLAALRRRSVPARRRGRHGAARAAARIDAGRRGSAGLWVDRRRHRSHRRRSSSRAGQRKK